MRKQHAEVVVNAVAVEDVNLAEHDFRSVEDHLASAGTVSMHMHVDNDAMARMLIINVMAATHDALTPQHTLAHMQAHACHVLDINLQRTHV